MVVGIVFPDLHARPVRPLPVVQVPDAQLRQMASARRAPPRTRVVLRQLHRRGDRPRATGHVHTPAVRGLRRPAVLRLVRRPQASAGAARPRTRARRHGQGLQFVLRPDRRRRVVQARQAVQSPVQHAGRTVESAQVQVESDFHHHEAQVHVGRHKRLQWPVDRQSKRTDHKE